MPKIVSEYDQEIPQSQTGDNPVATLSNHWDAALLSISQARRYQFRCLLLLYHTVFLDKFCILIYLFYHCRVTGMLNGNEASPIIISASQCILVKTPITLKPQGIV